MKIADKKGEVPRTKNLERQQVKTLNAKNYERGSLIETINRASSTESEKQNAIAKLRESFTDHERDVVFASTKGMASEIARLKALKDSMEETYRMMVDMSLALGFPVKEGVRTTGGQTVMISTTENKIDLVALADKTETNGDIKVLVDLAIASKRAKVNLGSLTMSDFPTGTDLPLVKTTCKTPRVYVKG